MGGGGVRCLLFDPESGRVHGASRPCPPVVVQGSAADLIKLAMVNLHRRIQHEDLPLKLLLQIHDELVLESPEADAKLCATIVQEEMQGAMSLAVPLNVEVGIGPDWLAAK